MNLTWTNYLKIGFFAFLVMIVTFPNMGQSIEYNLDVSWNYAINFFAANNFVFGREIFFTYGPLGYLSEVMPIKNNFAISLIVNSVIRLWLIYNLLLIVTKSIESKSLIYKIISYCFLLFFCFIDISVSGKYQNWFSIFYLTLSFLYLFNLKENNFFILTAAFLSLLILLDKPGFAIINFLALFGYFALLILFERKFKLFLILIISFVVGYFAIWVALYRSFIGSINYLLTIPLFTTGYSMAMTTNPSNNWIWLSVSFIFFFLSCTAFIKRPILSKNNLLVFAIFFLPFLAVFKYGLTREDSEHLLVTLNFILFSSIFMMIIAKSVKRLLIVLITSIVCMGSFYFALPVNNTLSWRFLLNFEGYKNFYSQVMQFAHYKKN